MYWHKQLLQKPSICVKCKQILYLSCKQRFKMSKHLTANLLDLVKLRCNPSVGPIHRNQLGRELHILMVNK